MPAVGVGRWSGEFLNLMILWNCFSRDTRSDLIKARQGTWRWAGSRHSRCAVTGRRKTDVVNIGVASLQELGAAGSRFCKQTWRCKAGLGLGQQGLSRARAQWIGAPRKCREAVLGPWPALAADQGRPARHFGELTLIPRPGQPWPASRPQQPLAVFFPLPSRIYLHPTVHIVRRRHSFLPKPGISIF